MKNKGLIRITIDFDNPVQSDNAASVAVLTSLLEWVKNEPFMRRVNKGAEIPFEFNDEDKED